MIHEPAQAIEIVIPSHRQYLRDRRLRFIEQHAATPKVLPRGTGASLLGVLASTVLHVLVLGTLLWDGQLTVPRPDKNAEGAGASALNSNAEPGSTLVMVSLTSPSAVPTTDSLEDMASAGLAPNNLMVEVESLDAQPTLSLAWDENSQDDNAKTAEAAGNDAQHAMLLGMYMGQIKARIDRAWSRPRTEIGAARFDCQVQIAQNSRGDVTEVTLQACNSEPRWQLSLVAAIQGASPLPAPPDPSLFTDQLMLSFDAMAYQSGGSEQGYEPAMTDSRMVTASQR